MAAKNDTNSADTNVDENVVENVVESKKEVKKKTPQEFENELVPYTAFYDGKQYKEPLNISVNGYTRQIKRGVEVMIPRYVRNAIENAQRQKIKAAVTSQDYEEHYSNLVKQNIL